MRMRLAQVLALLGGFLLVLAIMAQFYAADRLVKTPIDVKSTTELTGTAALSDGTELVEGPVKAWSVTHSDTKLSTGDVASFSNSSCLVKDEGDPEGCVSADDAENRLISASTDYFATDRKTARAVNDPKYLPADAREHEGLINKWPFESKKQTYPYWDGLVGKAVDAVFDRTETTHGLQTYVYKVTTSGAPIEIGAGVPGTYDDDRELWIDPFTGKIIQQIDHQQRSTDDGKPALVLDIQFTDEQVAANVEEAKSNTTKLKLVTRTVPLVGWILGIPLLVIGLGLLWLAYRRPRGARARTDREPAEVSVGR